VLDQVWVDIRRQREIPVRIRLPAGDGPSRGAVRMAWAARVRRCALGEQWASHGLAVIHSTSGRDESLWRERPAGERMAGLRSGSGEAFLRASPTCASCSTNSRAGATGDARLRPLDLARVGMSGPFRRQHHLHLAESASHPRLNDRSHRWPVRWPKHD
jgi:hypothetical protein